MQQRACDDLSTWFDKSNGRAPSWHFLLLPFLKIHAASLISVCCEKVVYGMATGELYHCFYKLATIAWKFAKHMAILFPKAIQTALYTDQFSIQVTIVMQIAFTICETCFTFIIQLWIYENPLLYTKRYFSINLFPMFFHWLCMNPLLLNAFIVIWLYNQYF